MKEQGNLNKPAEWLFRLCAFTLTCVVLATIASAVMLALVMITVRFDKSNLSLFTIPAFVLTPIILWSFGVVLPLKKHGQTWGMQWFGVTLVRLDGETPGWGSIVARELMQLAGLGLIVGVFGFLWIFFNPEERTLYDQLSQTRVIRSPARLKAVEEFRVFRATKHTPGGA